MALLKMTVEDVVLDERGLPVVLLKEEDGVRGIPIWIGSTEARTIKSELSHERPIRPLTHDLLKKVLDLQGYRLLQVEVTDMREDTYFAELTLQMNGNSTKLDCRPSDGIALALRTDSPILIAEDLLVRILREHREALEKEAGPAALQVNPEEQTIH